MIRFVVGPERQIVPDLAGKLPGRGIWLSASGDVLMSAGVREGQDGNRHGPGAAEAVAGAGKIKGPDKALVRAFARAARGPVSVPADLLDILRAGLIQRVSSSLGLARRAGQAVAGFEKAREFIRTGGARLVLQASDGSEPERARFLTGLPPHLRPLAPSGVTVIDPLAGGDLGRIFGRDYVVHVAVAPGRLADSLIAEAGRLAGLTNRSEGTTQRETA